MGENKDYDIKELGEMIKSRGLDLAEDSVKLITEEVFNWIEKSAKASATPYDDIALIILPQLKAKALELEDKIDGKIG